MRPPAAGGSVTTGSVEGPSTTITGTRGSAISSRILLQHDGPGLEVRENEALRCSRCHGALR
jgi:hypothetical protein